MLDSAQIQFVKDNIKSMSYKELAIHLKVNQSHLADWCYLNGYSRKRIKKTVDSKHYQKIVSMIETHSLSEIAEACGLKLYSMQKLVQKLGIDVKGIRAKSSKVTKEMILPYLDKYSIEDIANKFGLSSWSMYRLFKIYGLESNYINPVPGIKAMAERMKNPTINQAKQFLAFPSKILKASDIPEELAELELLRIKHKRITKELQTKLYANI